MNTTQASTRWGGVLLAAFAAIALVASLGLYFFAHPQTAKAVGPTTIFSDDFESGNFSNWTSGLPESGKWEIDSSAQSGNNTKKARVKGENDPSKTLYESVSTVGYSSLSLSFRYRADSLETSGHFDKVEAQYSTDGGSNWTTIKQIDDNEDDEVWRTFTYNSFPGSANNNSNFRIRFRANLDNGNDKVWIDDVLLTGETIPTTITIHKVIDADGDLNTTNDQTPGEGWEFTLNGGDPFTTDSNGDTQVINVTPGEYSVAETQQQGYELIDASCTGADEDDGSQDGNEVTGIETSLGDEVSCTFYNKPLPEVPSCDLTSENPGFTTFDTFSLGDVDGQNSWSSTGAYDQAVVTNIYGYTTFGCQSLRLSNAVTSGSFGDQTFAAPVATPAGESSVASNNHYEAQFDIASTMPDEQPGLALSVSPDDGNGSRMSYLSFADESGGIRVTFYDVSDAGPLGTTASFNPTDLGLLDRSTPHTIKFVIDFVDGPANDVVKIYIDGNLVHTGTTWEDYYRYDPEQNGNGNQLFPIDTLIFRAAGTAAPGTSGKGYLFDNLSLETSNIVDEPQQCSVTVVSDTTNTVAEKGDAFAQALSFIHSAWTASIAGATWIWGDNPVVDTTVNETQTFKKTFEWSGPIDSAVLNVAADNYYTVKVNGNVVASEQSNENNFQAGTQDGPIDVSADIIEGVNTVEIVVTNKGVSGSSPTSNPAGLLYSLVVTSTEKGTDCESAPQEPPAPVCELNTELLQNGDFEAPIVTAPQKWDIFPSGTTGLTWLVDWFGGSLTYSSNNRPEVANLELHRGVNGWLPAGGSQYAELDTDWFGPTNSLNGEPAAVAISQTVGTEIGATYTASFDFSARPGTAAAENKLEVLANGNVIGTVGPVATAGNQTEWTSHSFSFVADSGSTTLTFRDAGTPVDSLGTFIDNASLVCSAQPHDAAPYCGDGKINQDWEQCEVGDEGCTAWCQWQTDQCTEDVFAHVVVDNVSNTGVGDASSDIYLGQGTNAIPSGTWFPVKLAGNVIVDPALSGYEDVPGVAVRRSNDGVTVLLHGSHTKADVEHVDGYLEFSDGTSATTQTSLSGQNKLEKGFNGTKGGAGNDEVWLDSGISHFWLTTTSADDGYTTGYEAPQCPHFSTVTMCKQDNHGNPLEGWTLTLLGDETDSFNVPVNSPFGHDSVSLDAGTSYVALASGTWGNQNGVNPVDAEYSTTDNWATHVDGYTGYGAGILELEINETDGYWGPYNSLHQYAQSFTPGTNGPVNFRIFDGDTNTHTLNAGWYGDNKDGAQYGGPLSVAIHKGFAGVTNETGCVTFDNVPYGEYIASELPQAGWQQTDGPTNPVQIDTELTQLSLENTELVPVTLEKWNDQNGDGVRDEGDAGIKDWSIVLKPQTLEPVETLSVDSSSPTGVTTSGALLNGHTYLVEVEGTWQNGSTRKVDAEYYSDNNWSSHGDIQGQPNRDDRQLDVVINDQNIPWGSYNGTHLYKAVLAGTNASATFRVFDEDNAPSQTAWYGDNTGTLTVRIYDVTNYIAKTGDDGTVTVDVLPGDYQAVEAYKEGWTQTSPVGPSYCEINTDENPSCSFGNHETETAPKTANVVATKIVCDAEEYLPNWGDGTHKPITATTATDWLAQGNNSEHCALAPGWDFQWVTDANSSTNPGDNSGEAGSPWTLFDGSTGNDGTVSAVIPAGGKVWVREVLKDGFVPFTGQNTNQDESAELYCNTDALNYDNWDWINPVTEDATYYCVAWNAPLPGAPTLTLVKHTDGYDGTFDFTVDGPDFSENPIIYTTNGSGTTTVQLADGGGTYTLAEILGQQTDWQLSNISCVYDNESAGTSLPNNEYQITVENGDNVTCTFVNETTCDSETEYFDEESGQCQPREGENYFDLSVNKTVEHDGTPAVGETVSYTITVTNSGDNAGSIYVNDLLPNGVTYTGHTASNGNENYDPDTGEWFIASLGGDGGQATLTITATINSGEEGQSIVNTATISGSDGVDTDSENDSDSASFTVQSSGGGGGGGDTPQTPTFFGGGPTDLGGGGGIVLGASTSTGEVLGESCGLYLNQHLRQGNPANDPEQVRKLQEFLNKFGYGHFTPTGYFGPLTFAAVKLFQLEYAASILTPWGLTEPTGLVYLTTLRQLNLIECPALTIDLPPLVPWQ